MTCTAQRSVELDAYVTECEQLALTEGWAGQWTLQVGDIQHLVDKLGRKLTADEGEYLRIPRWAGAHVEWNELSEEKRCAYERIYLHSAADLASAVRDLRPDAVALGYDITADWCRDQMHDLGITRYEDVDADTLGAIVDRVDTIGGQQYTRLGKISRQASVALLGLVFGLALICFVIASAFWRVPQFAALFAGYSESPIGVSGGVRRYFGGLQLPTHRSQLSPRDNEQQTSKPSNWIDKALQKGTAQLLGFVGIVSGGCLIWISGCLLDRNGRRLSRLMGAALGGFGVLLFGIGFALIGVY